MPIDINSSFKLMDIRDLAAGSIAAANKGGVGEGYILGLGYKTRPIEETLRDEAKWLKENGKI